MTRSLSTQEAQLILQLEWDKQPVVTIPQAMKTLGVSNNHARQLLHRLARDHWLAQIVPGKYELIPAERGSQAFVDTNPLFIGSTLIEPYYFSFATAAFFHGLSTQASATVYIATIKGKSRQRLVRGKEYRFVIQPPYKFFGAIEVSALGNKVLMAEPEKAAIDSLDQPPYAGGMPEVAAMLVNGKGRLNWKRLAEYALRYRSHALIQRLGYLAEVLELKLDTGTRKVLLASIGTSITYLGVPSQWKKGGKYDAAWQIVDNIPRRELLAEIEVR